MYVASCYGTVKISLCSPATNMYFNALTRNHEFHQHAKHIDLVAAFHYLISCIWCYWFIFHLMLKSLSKERHELHWGMMGMFLWFERETQI